MASRILVTVLIWQGSTSDLDKAKGRSGILLENLAKSADPESYHSALLSLRLVMRAVSNLARVRAPRDKHEQD